ncbi:uncharacterized protein LOC144877311 [Branchiostoma floridae x Branchiostoma japonicum]
MMNAIRYALSVTARVCPRTGLGLLARKNPKSVAEMASTFYRSAPRTQSDKSSSSKVTSQSQMNCLSPNFGSPGGHAHWAGAGLAIGAGVVFAAGLYKTTVNPPKKTTDDIDDVTCKKTGLEQAVLDSESPAGVLTRTEATSSSEGRLESGTTGENSQVETGRDPADELFAQADDIEDSSALETARDMLTVLPKNDIRYGSKSSQQTQRHHSADHIWIRILLYLLMYMGCIKMVPARVSAQACRRAAAEHFSRSPHGGASDRSSCKKGFGPRI